MKTAQKIAGPLLVIVAFLLGWLTYSLGREWFLIYVFFGGVIIMALAALLDETRKTSRGSTEAPATQSKAGTEHIAPNNASLSERLDR